MLVCNSGDELGFTFSRGRGQLAREDLGETRTRSGREPQAHFTAQASRADTRDPKIVASKIARAGFCQFRRCFRQSPKGQRRTGDLAENLAEAFNPGLNELGEFRAQSRGGGFRHLDFSLASVRPSAGFTAASTRAARRSPQRAGRARNISCPAMSRDAGSAALRAKLRTLPGASPASALTATRKSFAPSSA